MFNIDKPTFRKALAVFYSLSAVIFIFCYTFIEIPLSNSGDAKIILGFVLGTMLGKLLEFYFGNSDLNFHNKIDEK